VMNALIEDLLQFSRLGRQSINAAPLDMAELIGEVWPRVAPTAADFRLSPLPEARGDRALLKQVWINLLSNAVKYSSGRELPCIEVSGQVEGREAIYAVRDNGAGFDMRYYEKLFGVFQRLHSSEEFTGTGVGLAIVQNIVTRHGGRVWAEGKVGEGALFQFSLPLNPDDRLPLG
jgi:light-regulated signal transduction histidine kinase (bacteriophytochrome)